MLEGIDPIPVSLEVVISDASLIDISLDRLLGLGVVAFLGLLTELFLSTDTLVVFSLETLLGLAQTDDFLSLSSGVFLIELELISTLLLQLDKSDARLEGPDSIPASSKLVTKFELFFNAVDLVELSQATLGPLMSTTSLSANSSMALTFVESNLKVFTGLLTSSVIVCSSEVESKFQIPLQIEVVKEGKSLGLRMPKELLKSSSLLGIKSGFCFNIVSSSSVKVP